MQSGSVKSLRGGVTHCNYCWSGASTDRAKALAGNHNQGVAWLMGIDGAARRAPDGMGPAAVCVVI